LKEWDDEIHRALAHPIRRRIIECLQKNDLSFPELLKRVGVANHGKLGFHIRALMMRPHACIVEQDASTKKYHLTDRGQLAGELIWDIRYAIERGRRDLVHEPTRYVRRLRAGDHAVFYYDTEEVKRNITFPFLEVGLPKGEAIVYVVSENKLDSESQALQRYGIGADYFGTEAFTIMSDDEWFMKEGKAQPNIIIDNWRAIAKEKQKAGFTGVRGAVEMKLMLNYSREQLLRLETMLGKQFTINQCVMCLYDVNRLEEKQVIQLSKCHGHEIFKDIALKTP